MTKNDRARALMGSVYATQGLFMRARASLLLARAAKLRDMPDLVAGYLDECARFRRLAKVARTNYRDLVDASIRRYVERAS